MRRHLCWLLGHEWRYDHRSCAQRCIYCRAFPGLVRAFKR